MALFNLKKSRRMQATGRETKPGGDGIQGPPISGVDFEFA
jgi:hypothetical protein